MSDSPHQLIADVAQVLLRTNGAALCVRRALDAALAPGQLTVVGGPLEVGDCHPYTAAIFHMLTHGPSYRTVNWPAGGAR